MKISLITDEISDDAETAIEIGVEWGVRDFELRGFFTQRVPHFLKYQKQRLREILDLYQANIIAISPGLFKIPFPPKHAPQATLGWMGLTLYDEWSNAQRLVRYHLEELLPRSIDYACELGARLVIVFGFGRGNAPPGEVPEEVLNCLRIAAERAGAMGLQLALEPEAGFWADTGEHTAQIVKAIHHPALGINWDPANALWAGDMPYPDGYQAVRGWIRHVHFKDVAYNRENKPYYTLHGQIDWKGQIQALMADQYEGYISIETHLRPKIAAAREALERLHALTAT